MATKNIINLISVLTIWWCPIVESSLVLLGTKLVEVMNRFKGLDLVGRVSEELWPETHNNEQQAVTKTIPQKKKCKVVV